MEFCPNVICVRRTKIVGSDRINLAPIHALAYIKRVIINIDEPVNIRFLGFHVKDKAYCDSLKIQNTNKRFCTDIKSQYVHFHLIKEGYQPEKSMFLLAFLPRIKTENEMEQVVKELCDVIEWLEMRQQTNCVVFRYGSPRHQKDNRYQWQKSLDRIISETKDLYTIGRVVGRIKHIHEDDERCLTISTADLFDSINVS